MIVRNSYQESNILKMHFASLRLCAKLGSQRRRDAKSIKDKGCEKYSTTNLFCQRVLVTDSHKITNPIIPEPRLFLFLQTHSTAGLGSSKHYAIIEPA